VLLPMLTEPLAVMCSLLPAVTSMPVSNHLGLPLTETSALLLAVAVAAAGGDAAANDNTQAHQKELLRTAAMKIQPTRFTA